MSHPTPHAAYHLGVYTELLSPATGDGALVLYLAGYIFLILSLAAVLGFVTSPVQTLAHSQVLLTVVAQARVRWFLIFVLLSLAGLPPFFFFGCKLGLLGLLLTGGTLVTNLTVAALVLLSWAVYFSAVRRLLCPVTQTTSAGLRDARLTPRQAYALVLCLGALCFGLFLFEDAALLLLGQHA